jgi:hypothetical protein
MRHMMLQGGLLASAVLRLDHAMCDLERLLHVS